MPHPSNLNMKMFFTLVSDKHKVDTVRLSLEEANVDETSY